MNATIRDSLEHLSGEQLLVLRVLEGDAALPDINSELDRRARQKLAGVASMKQTNSGLPRRRLSAAA